MDEEVVRGESSRPQQAESAQGGRSFTSAFAPPFERLMLWPTSQHLGPINSICQLNGGPGALSEAPRPSKCLVRGNGICPVEGLCSQSTHARACCRGGGSDKVDSICRCDAAILQRHLKMEEYVITSH